MACHLFSFVTSFLFFSVSFGHTEHLVYECNGRPEECIRKEGSKRKREFKRGGENATRGWRKGRKEGRYDSFMLDY